MSTKRRLRDRVMSFVLACIMLCSLFMVDGVIPEAEAELAFQTTDVLQQLDMIPIRAGFGRTGEIYTFRFKVGLSVVGDNGNVVAGPIWTEFTARYDSPTDVKFLENPSNVKFDEGDPTYDSLFGFYDLFGNREANDFGQIRALCEQADNADPSHGAGFYTGLLGKPIEEFMNQGCGKHFKRTVEATMVSVKADPSKSPIETYWNETGQMTLTYSALVYSSSRPQGDSDEPVVAINGNYPWSTATYVPTLDSFELKLTREWYLDNGIMLDLYATYVKMPPDGYPHFSDEIIYSGRDFMSEWSLFRFDTNSNFLSDESCRNPVSDEDFKPVSDKLKGPNGEAWDGFLPYRTVIKGLKAAYGKILPVDQVEKMLTGVTEKNASDFATVHNMIFASVPSNIYAVDGAPGLFYDITRRNPDADWSEPTEDLVKNIRASYNASTDEYTIYYELRSTDNTVNFKFYPIAVENNQFKTITDLNPGGKREVTGQNAIYHQVQVEVSVLGFPKGIPEMLEKDKDNADLLLSAGFNGNVPAEDRSLYEAAGGYFTNAQYFYAYDCIKGAAGKILPYSATGSALGGVASDQPGANFCLGDGYTPANEEAMNALYNKDNGSYDFSNPPTPKFTYNAVMMRGANGDPQCTGVFWDGSAPDPSPSGDGNGTVILDWNMQGYPAVELRDASVSEVGLIDGTGDGGLGSVVYNHVKDGDNIVFDGRYQTGMGLLIPDLPVGADIPYDRLRTLLLEVTCGDEKRVISADKYAQMTPLKNGYYYSFAVPDMSGTGSTLVVAMWRGVSTQASGGQIIPGTPDLSQVTPIPVPQGTINGKVSVLYGQWEFFTIGGGSSTGGGGGGGGTGNGDFHTVVFNYGYYGAPSITETVGKCDVQLSLNAGDASSTATVSVALGLYDPMEYYAKNWGNGEKFFFRPGWVFVGWAENPSHLTESVGDGWSGNELEYGDLYYDGEIKKYAENPDRDITFYGLWMPRHIDWNVNGGYFTSVWGADPGEITTKGHVNETTVNNRANPIFADAESDDAAPFIRQIFHDPVSGYVTVMHGIRCNPLRLGYRFAGWFYDEWCVIPLDENETGIQPGRTYFAGWEPDPVYVRYYDTREGGGLITEQQYKYGDKLVLLDNMQDTDGQAFSNWVVNVDGKELAATSVTDLVNQAAYDPATHSMRPVSQVLTPYKRDNDGSSEPISWDEATMGIKTTTGAILNYDRYWVLNVYTNWDEKTADYTASIDWVDFENNDGCRPTSVKVGLRSSLNDRTVDEADISGSPTANRWTHTFTDLPITTSDSSVEEITYDIYMISYTDSKGNVHEIRDTTATSGEITVATRSEADTAISATYQYGINNYMTRGPKSRNYAGKITFDYGLITTGTDIKFTIQWKDGSNRDGQRPGAVRLILLADGQPVQVDTDHNSNTGFVDVNPGMCEVSPDGNTWTYTFEDYQKYRNGKAIEYSVAVVNDGTGRYDYASNKFNANGYTTTYITDKNGTSDPAGAIISRPIEKVNKTINVHWDDEQNRDGFRPDSVTVNLYAYQYNARTDTYDKAYATSAVVSGTGDNWTYTFFDLYKNSCGVEIIYLAEIGSDLNALIPEKMNKYTWTNQDLNITISRQPDTKGVTATIQWNDYNNNDGIRPDRILLELYADGKPLTEAFGIAETDWKVVLSGDPTADEWTYYYEDLPVFAEGESGRRIIYSLKVSEDGTGTLYGSYEERGVLGETYTFPRYTASYPEKSSGLPTEDFTSSAQPIVQLTHIKNMIEVPVSVIWNDSNNQDGQRPSFVTLALTAYQWNANTYKWEYMEAATKTVNADFAINTMTADEWTANFGYRDMYHDGLKVIYHLAVTSDLNAFLPDGAPEYGWVESAHGNQVDAIPQVTISQNVGTTSAQATVLWDDNHDQDAIRPRNIVLQLYAHAPGETPAPAKGLSYRVTLTGDPKADTWTYTFNGMPKYAEGQSGVELIYTIQAIEADGEPLYGYYIITANGEEEEVLRYEASYLHENDDGTTENTLDADLSDRAYVKLSHIAETKTMNFSVNWHDGDNRDNVRPSSVPAALYKTVGDGEPVYLRAMTITAGKTGTWTQKVTDLPGHENGMSVKYTVQVPEDAQRELAASGYTVMVQDNIIHMNYTPRTGSISMKLYWSDNEDNDGYRPDSVAAELYANGVATGKTIDLNATNNWSATWTDLDAHYVDGTATGTDVVYSVRVEAPEGYAVAYEPESTTIDAGDTLYVRLTHEGDTADVPVKIYWNDQSNNDGKRPETLTVQLLADGQEAVGKTLTLNAGNADGSANIWSGKFEDMPVYGGNGEKVYYSLKVYDPTTATGGYSVMTAGTTLYLSYKPVKSSMYVSFQFDDGLNADGVRPTGLYLQLTANGVPVDDSEYKHTVSFDTNVDGYVWNFGELPVYAADGTKIAYNVVVTFAPELGSTDYEVWTSADIKLSESASAAANQIIVKLSRSVSTRVLDGRIFWFDCNNVAGQRPDALDLVMRDDADGSSVRYTVNAKTGEVTDRGTNQVVGSVSVAEWTGDSSVWYYTISGVPGRYAHKVGSSYRIYYYVTANTTSIARYYPTVLTGEDYGMDVALTHKDYETYATKASQDYTVDLMWLDNSDAWGLRPDSAGVKVDLLANGGVYDTVVLTKDNAKDGNPNAWTYTFKDIPTYRDGGAIVWSVALPDVDKYIQEQTVSTAASSTCRFTQAIGFDLTANWDDSDNDDAVRPESITVGVYGDGALADTVTLTGTGNTWTGSTSALPVWRESDSDAAVQYTFLWDETTEQYLSGKGYTAVPTVGGQDAQSSRFYWLSTEAFGDHEAEGFDTLSGTYDWETTLRYQQEKADYHFTVTFADDADRDGVRPDTVKVELLADGEVIDTREIPVNASESMYDLAWDQLNVNEAGEAIAYTIRLVSIPKNYTANYNSMNTSVTLTHNPDTITVTGTVNWDDSTELVDVYNANGTYVRSYEQIQRTGVYVRLLANGEPCGEPVYISKTTYGEGENLKPSASADWTGLYKYQDHGTAITYTIEVYSDELTALLDDGHSLTYDFGTKYAPEATVTHDLYDIRGTVYYMYSYSDDFLLAGVPVTAYLQCADGSYKAAGSTVTSEDGTFELLNLPQGLYIIRATYQYGQNTMAGTKGAELDRKDASAIVIVNREAVNDSDRYRYTAGGEAYYQTDAADDSTVKPVPEGSVVLLYRLDDGKSDPTYVGMTTTDAEGCYRFEDLVSADYVVNVVFNYDGGTYTYDNGDALADGLSFNVLGADMTWPDIVKQVNANTDIKDPDDPVNPPVDPPEKPEPCIVSGNVFYADGGVHTTDPVVGADVYVYLSSNAEVGHTVTDENGRWSMEGLGAADYIAVFSYQGNASRVLLFTITEADYEAATQYFDRTVETPAGTVKGVVLDENGQTMRALVGIYDANGTLLDFAYTDTYGNYEFTVAAGYDYNIKILAVEDEVARLSAGDPDDDLTTLDYYVLSGTFAIDGVTQAGKLVAVYYEQDGDYSLVTATLTDGYGKFAAKVYGEGNYKVCPYINEQIYETRYVSVGYQEERPSVSTAINGSYTVSGIEDYDALVLYKVTDGVETTVHEAPGGSGYEIENLDTGEYRLKLTKGGNETWYYFTCPEGALVDVTYYVTVSGSVLDENGKAVTGAKAEIFDAEGKPAGETVTILSDGGYAWHELPEGKHTVVVTRPNTSAVIADKWTHEPDSYGIAYEDGMASGGTWTWNVNAHVVSGKVTDQKGEPIVGAYVTFENGPDAGSRFVAITGADGTYSIGLAPGEYSVSAVYHWDADHTYNATGTIYQRVEQDVSGVDFTITRHELSIKAVRMADGTPAPGTDLEVRYEDGTLFWSGKAGDDGMATVTVFPGKYLISGKYDGSGAAKAEATVVGDMDVTLKLDSVVYIRGTVRDGNGNVVPDGLVYYDNGKGNSSHVYTNDEGYYEIPVASDALGDYEIYAARGTAAGEKTTINVLTDVVLDLLVSQEQTPEDYVISGVVTDEDGNRLANTLVTMTWGNDKANKVTTSTNSKGEYAFTVADGTYYLTAAYEAGNGELYETNSEAAVHVNGADVAKNLVILIGYEVVVTVVDANGDPVDGATVCYQGAASGEAGTGPDGTVSLHLPKGDYQVWAETTNRNSDTADLTVDGPESLTLELENAGIFYEEPEVSNKGQTIWGFVHDPDGMPVEGASVELYRQDLETLEWNLVDSAETDADGRYEFSGLENGTYRVDTVHTYETEADATEDGWVVSGTVTDDAGDPLTNCKVELWTEAGDLIAEVTTGEDGEYTFEGVDPDESYVVKAWDAAEEPVMDEPAGVTATSAVISGTALDVAGIVVPGAKIEILDAEGNTVATTVADETGCYSVAVDGDAGYRVVMELPASYEVDTETYVRDTTDRNAPYLEPSWYTIEGYVHDNDGEPVEGAEVILTDEDGDEVDRYVTEADGYYVFDHLADGIYHVHVVSPDGSERDYTVKTGDDSNNIDVVVTNYSKGTVTAPDGGWYDGWNSFTVECNLACLVYVKDADGSMTRLEAEATDENNTYRFTADLSEGDEIIVLVRGDVDLNGKLTLADLVRLSRYFGGMNELGEYAELAADVNLDSKLTLADLVFLSRYFGGGYELGW